MVDYKSATPEQKRMAAFLLEALLKQSKLEKHYKILESKEGLLIVELSLTSPAQRQALASGLKRITCLTTEAVQREVPVNFFTKSTVTFYNVKSIDVESLKLEMNKLKEASAKAPGVDALIWARIPEEVRIRWGRFNKDLQNHIIECMSVDLSTRFSNLSTDDLGTTFESPIGLSLPTIPVRLPASSRPTDPKADINKVYDLVEVFNFPRDPKDRSRRCHPLTRAYFSLNEVEAAPDALKELKSRAEQLAGASSSSSAPRRTPLQHRAENDPALMGSGLKF